MFLRYAWDLGYRLMQSQMQREREKKETMVQQAFWENTLKWMGRAER